MTYKAGDLTGREFSGREREREKAVLTYRGVTVFGIERMGILLLIFTWNKRSELT